MMAAPRAERFHSARSDPGLAVLEGFHALKHALRFGAEIVEAATVELDAMLELAAALAPDIVARLPASITDVVPAEELARLVPRPPATGVVAIARRRDWSAVDALGAAGPAPVVALVEPRHAGNIGAAIRVAAAAGAAGLLVVGSPDPWHPAAVRGAAGLQYALPVARVDALPDTERPLVAVDPGGEPLGARPVPPRAVLAFGSERHGLSEPLLAQAHARVAIPMRAGVSSLNLATAVAVVLYTWRGGA